MRSFDNDRSYIPLALINLLLLVLSVVNGLPAVCIIIAAGLVVYNCYHIYFGEKA